MKLITKITILFHSIAITDNEIFSIYTIFIMLQIPTSSFKKLLYEKY